MNMKIKGDHWPKTTNNDLYVQKLMQVVATEWTPICAKEWALFIPGLSKSEDQPRNWWGDPDATTQAQLRQDQL